MWSRIKFISGTNPSIEWKSALIYKAWHLRKLKIWQDVTWVWWKKYGQEYYSSELSVLDEEMWENRWRRIESEVYQYESLIAHWFLESCIFDFHDANGYIHHNIRLDRNYVLSEFYDEDLIRTSFPDYTTINYITVYYLLNEWITQEYLHQYIINSKDDKTIINVWAQLILFTKQLTPILYHLNLLHKDFWLRRFEYDASINPIYTDWFACLLLLEDIWMIYIDAWWPQVISTDKINIIFYVRIMDQEKFRNLVKWFAEEDLKELERQEQPKLPSNKINEKIMITEVWLDYFISYNQKRLTMTWTELKIITKLYNTNSNIISLSNATFKQTPWAFQKTLVRLRVKMKEWWLNLIKVRWKWDSYNLKKLEIIGQD